MDGLSKHLSCFSFFFLKRKEQIKGLGILVGMNWSRQQSVLEQHLLVTDSFSSPLLVELHASIENGQKIIFLKLNFLYFD